MTLQYTTTGSSMEPIIFHGATLSIDYSIKNLYPGDIVAFVRNEVFVAHRLIKSGRNLITQGDSCQKPDQPLSRDQIIGKVTQISYPAYTINLCSLPNLILGRLIVAADLIETSHWRLYHLKRWLLRQVVWQETKSNKYQGVDLTLHLQLIVQLLNNQPPQIWNPRIDYPSLFLLATENKAVPALLGLIKTRQIPTKIRKQVLALKDEMHYMTGWMEAEKQKIGRLFDQNHIWWIDLKHIPSSPNHPNTYRWGVDIDILVAKSSLKKATQLLIKQGYQIKSKPPQEITFTTTSTDFNIDLHWLIAQPFLDKLVFNSSSKTPTLQTLTKRILADTKKAGIHHITQSEILLLTLIIRYWTNDFHMGLRNLHDIKTLAETADFSQAAWNQLLDKYHLKHLAEVTLAVSGWIFSPASNSDTVPSRIMKKHFSLKHIGLLPPKENFWTMFDKMTEKHWTPLGIISKISYYKQSLFQLIRPKIITFVVSKLV